MITSGKPESLRCGATTGQSFRSGTFLDSWAAVVNIQRENGCKTGTSRVLMGGSATWLNVNSLREPPEARRKIEKLAGEYNAERPQQQLELYRDACGERAARELDGAVYGAKSVGSRLIPRCGAWVRQSAWFRTSFDNSSRQKKGSRYNRGLGICLPAVLP
jgi:hypothetical protein